MLDWLKSAWTSSKVRVSVVGGVLVVATAYGTCSVDPEQASEAETAPQTETTETVPVSNTETTSDSTEATNTE